MAAKMGAAGAIVIHTTPSAGYGWQVIQTSWNGELFELPEDGTPRVTMKMWATDDLAKKVAALGGKDLDALREERGGALLPARASRRHVLAGVHEHRVEEGIRKRDRRPPRVGSEARGRGGDLHGAPRPPRDEGRRQAGSRRDLQRRARQRLRRRRRPRDRPGVRGAPEGSGALGLLRARGGGGAGAPRLRVAREAPARPGRPDRGERQRRRDRRSTGRRATSG